VLGSFLAIMVLVILVQALVSGYVLRGAFLDNLETDLAREARGFAVTLPTAVPATGTAAGGAALTDPAALEEFARRMGAATAMRITVIARDGTVLADSEEDPALMENHRGRLEVATALAGSEGRARRVSATLKQEMLYVAVPIGPGDAPWSTGVVRVAVPTSRVDPLLGHVLRLPFLVGLLLLAPILLLAYLVSRSFTRPIESLRTMAVGVADGDLSHRVGLRRSDELGQLGQALNYMAGELESRVSRLAAEEEQSAEILAAMSDGVLVLDVSGVVVRVNTAAARMLGVSADDMPGRPLVQTARSFPVQAMAERACATGAVVTDEVRLPDARVLWVQAVPLRLPHHTPEWPARGGDAAGRPDAYAQVVLVFRDETARRRAEDVRRDFVANVSHELKTPLAGLSLLADTLQQAVHDDPEQAERFAERVGAEVGRLTDLVTDLLVLSRLEQPRPAMIDLQLVDLAEITAAVVDGLRLQPEASQLTIELDAATPVRVRGDGVHLATLVRNLVENALRYNHPGGHVWVSVRPDGDRVLMFVRDDGLGIPRQELARIFERFYRVDKARSRETGGTGLGLSIVKHVAESHGGLVQVESTVGVGSTFTVTLPAA
jgi:two-component system phosphate regulon sensor histidine kinase PhoR